MLKYLFLYDGNPNPTATGEGLPGLKKQLDLKEKKMFLKHK